MEKKINILGEDIVLRFNMSVQLAFEEVTGEAFSLESISKRKSQLALYIAAILSNNPETSITFERLMTEAKAEDIRLLDNTIGELMADWYNLPKPVAKAIEEDNKKVARKKGGKKEKH